MAIPSLRHSARIPRGPSMISGEINEIFRNYRSDKEIFHNLMPLQTREILLVAPAFDAFTLEQDGLLTEILFDSYYHLSMSNPPRVTNVSTCDEALEILATRHFDLIIVMSRLGQAGHVELARQLRKADPKVPIPGVRNPVTRGPIYPRNVRRVAVKAKAKSPTRSAAAKKIQSAVRKHLSKKARSK